jgi:hypothetical protein
MLACNGKTVAPICVGGRGYQICFSLFHHSLCGFLLGRVVLCFCGFFYLIFQSERDQILSFNSFSSFMIGHSFLNNLLIKL